MKIIFGGACITSGTGKLGGSVVQGGAFGPMIRQGFRPRVRTINNQFQPCEKEVFTSVSKEWHSLTLGQIAAWNAYAIAPMNGFQTWLKFNLTYFRMNNTFLFNPVALPVIPSSIIINSAGASGPVDFVLNASYTASVNPNKIQLFVSINNSAGQTKLVKSRLRLVASQTAIAGANAYIFTPTLFGVTWLFNRSQFIGIRLFDTVTGFLSPFQTIQFNS